MKVVTMHLIRPGPARASQADSMILLIDVNMFAVGTHSPLLFGWKFGIFRQIR